MNGPTSPPQDLPENNFDLLRFAMAILVIFAHAYPLSQRGGIDPVERWTLGQVSSGSVAVYVFFAVSGYLIAASRARSRSAFAFISRRLGRIYPGLVVALAISAFVVTPLAMANPSGYFSVETMLRWIFAAVTLHLWWHPVAFPYNALPGLVNGSLWTIRYEAACYLLLLVAGSARFSRNALLVLALTAMALNAGACFELFPTRNVSLGWIAVSPRSASVFASIFLAGALGWHFTAAMRSRPSRIIVSVAALLIAARLPGVRAFDLVAPVALTYLTLACAFARTPLLHGFAPRVGGDYSYGIYLYAFPIQQVVTMAFGGSMHPLVNFLISTPVAIAAGALSWHQVEKRFVSRRRARAVATPDGPTAPSQ